MWNGGDYLAIIESEFKYEKEKFISVKQWLKKEISIIRQNDEELKYKIAELKKQSKGGYNEELETLQKLYKITHKNLENYNESLSSPYFARIDFREYRKDKEAYYIGKFGLGDSKTGDEVVIDWRAPLADLYYSGTEGKCYYKAPVGIIEGELSLKRKFLIRDNELKDAFDEGINEIILKSGMDVNESRVLVDEFLKINLEETTSSKLKDVVATIQKEQNAIIRAEKNNAIIVQGSAGSGKTTIALHRLAFLLYKYRNKLLPEQILVVAPNKLFLDYISDFLPGLGVENVKQVTFETFSAELLKLNGKILTKDKKLSLVLEEKDEEKIKFITGSSRFKGSMMFKTIIDRYIRYLEKADINIEDIEVENYTLFKKEEIKRLYTKDLVNLPLNKRKDEIQRYLSLKLKEKTTDVLGKIDFQYEYQIAKLKKSMEDGELRRKELIRLYDERDAKKKDIAKSSTEFFNKFFNKWKVIRYDDLYSKLFFNKEIFSEVTDNKIPAQLAEYIIKKLHDNFDNKLVDSDDLAPMLYLKFKVDGVPEKYKYQHIVIDEAQDYSMFQLAIFKEVAVNNSLTIVGDIGQGIYYYKGIDDWDKVNRDIFEGNGRYIPLSQSYRSTIEIIDFANHVLKQQKNNLKPAIPVLRHGKAPSVKEFKSNKEFAAKLDKIVEEVKDMNKNTVAVIGRTYDECKKIKDFLKKCSKYDWEIVKDTDNTFKYQNIIIPSYMTKGLEFDCSVIFNCNDENYSDTEIDKKVLYVVLTRALHLEYIFYKGRKSNLIEC